MEKGSFLLFREYGKEVQMLSNEEAGELFKAIYAYECGTEVPELSGAAGLLFSIFRRKLDGDRERYTAICEAKRNAGRKGGVESAKARKASASSAQAKQARASSASSKSKQSQANQANPNLNPNLNPKENTPPTPPEGEDTGFGPRLQSVFEDWLRYKKERRQGYKPTSLQKLVTRLRKSAEAFGEDAVAELIEESIACGYQGILFDRLRGHSRDKPPSFSAPIPDYGDKEEYL